MLIRYGCELSVIVERPTPHSALSMSPSADGTASGSTLSERRPFCPSISVPALSGTGCSAACCLRVRPPCFSTASSRMGERVDVCRDFTHLAVTLCRCMNIPARYVNGYLGDISVPCDPAPMDFNA